jgi:hypothetical protein
MIKQTARSFLVGLSLSAMIFSPFHLSANQTASTNYNHVRLDGDIVVVLNQVSYDDDVVIFDLSDGSTKVVHTQGSVSSPDVSGDYVVYNQSSNVHLYQISTHTDTIIATDAQWPTSLRIDGDYVIYTNDSDELVSYSISRGRFNVLADSSYEAMDTAITDGLVAFESAPGGFAAAKVFVNTNFPSGNFAEMPTISSSMIGGIEAHKGFVAWQEFSPTPAIIQVEDTVHNLSYTFYEYTNESYGSFSIDVDPTRKYPAKLAAASYFGSLGLSAVWVQDVGNSIRTLVSATDPGYSKTDVQIDGDHIVWLQYSSSGMQVRHYSISTGVESTILD